MSMTYHTDSGYRSARGIGAKKRKPREWREAHEKVISEGACRNCGDTHALDPAHTIPRSQGGRDTAESVVPLCRSCHDAQHRNELELLPLMTREEELAAVEVVGLGRAYGMLTSRDERRAA